MLFAGFKNARDPSFLKRFPGGRKRPSILRQRVEIQKESHESRLFWSIFMKLVLLKRGFLLFAAKYLVENFSPQKQYSACSRSPRNRKLQALMLFRTVKNARDPGFLKRFPRGRKLPSILRQRVEIQKSFMKNGFFCRFS